MKRYSRTSKSLSFPNASIGNPDETTTGPPIRTFGGDSLGVNSHNFFLIRGPPCCRGDSFSFSESERSFGQRHAENRIEKKKRTKRESEGKGQRQRPATLLHNFKQK